MSTLDETGGNVSQAAGALRDGLEVSDANAEVEFQAYTAVVLPIDGFNFWQPTVRRAFKGSFHFSQEVQQNVDETVGFATVRFSTPSPITEFDGPINTIWIARHRGFRYAFSQQQGFYQQAGIWHYWGNSILPAFESTLLDQGNTIDINQAVVSNSLPAWMALNTYQNPLSDKIKKLGFMLYPAYLLPGNLVPPYGVIDIGENDTSAIQSVPYIDPKTRSHWQLAKDTVRITLYGLQNNAALDFLDFVNQYILMTDAFGLMNMPIVRDAQRFQAEQQTLAMKKVLTYEVSYYQARIQTIAQQLIEQVLITYIFPSRSS